MVGGLEDELCQDVLHLDQLPEPAGAGGCHHVPCSGDHHLEVAMRTNTRFSGGDEVLEVFLMMVTNFVILLGT